MDDLEIFHNLRIPARELVFDVAAAPGPGGQHVNRNKTQAILYWTPAASSAVSVPQKALALPRLAGKLSSDGILQIRAHRFRSLEANRRDALDRLRELLVEVLTPPVRRKRTRVPRGVKERRLQAKRRRSDLKQARKRPGAEEW